MKYSKRYIAFTVVILFVFLVKFHVLGVDNASVGRKLIKEIKFIKQLMILDIFPR